MTGALSDIVSRLRAVLPKRWFGDDSPILVALLQSIATSWVWIYGIVIYAISQTRLNTATDDWLDLISHDYFGNGLGRGLNEPDTSFRVRIQSALVREAATRSAVSEGLLALTGSAPAIFEPANCLDTGSYGTLSESSPPSGTGAAYGQAGGWGSLALPLQIFVTVTQPVTPGVGMLAGYGTPNGGYGVGVIGYGDLSLLLGNASEQDIQSTLGSLLPVNVTAWLKIQ